MLKKYKDTIIKTTIIFILGFLFFTLIRNFNEVTNLLVMIINLISPFIVGLVIAYILNPLVKLIEKKANCKRGISIFFTYFILVSLIVFSFIFIIPKLYECIVDLINQMPSYTTSINNWIKSILNNQDIETMLNSLGTNIGNDVNILSIIGNMFSIIDISTIFIKSFSNLIINIFLGTLISIYVLIDKDRFKQEIKKITYIILKKEKAESIIEFIKLYNDMIGSYIGIKMIDSMIVAVISFIGLTLVGSEYATLIALISGFATMIPYFGAITAQIIGFLLNIFTSPIKAIIVFVVLVAIHLFEGWFLEPKLVGDKVGIRPILLILGVSVFGGLFGLIGILLSAPTMATIKVYYDKWIDKNKNLIKDI